MVKIIKDHRSLTKGRYYQVYGKLGVLGAFIFDDDCEAIWLADIIGYWEEQ